MSTLLDRRALLRAAVIAAVAACTRGTPPDPPPVPDPPDLGALLLAHGRAVEAATAYERAALATPTPVSTPLAALGRRRAAQAATVEQYVRHLRASSAPTPSASTSPSASPSLPPAPSLPALIAMERRHSAAHLAAVNEVAEAKHALLLADLAASAAQHVIAVEWLAR